MKAFSSVLFRWNARDVCRFLRCLCPSLQSSSSTSVVKTRAFLHPGEISRKESLRELPLFFLGHRGGTPSSLFLLQLLFAVGRKNDKDGGDREKTLRSVFFLSLAPLQTPSAEDARLAD